MAEQAGQQPEAAQPAPPAAPTRRSMAEIASEMFGKDFYGTEKTEEVQPEKIEEPKPDDTEKGEEPPVEEPIEGEELPEAAKEPAPEDTGETPIDTLSDLVKHYELDPEWAQTLKVSVNVDGTSTEATIGDLIKSYQITEAAEHRLEAAKQISQKESEAWAAKQQELDGQFNVLAELIGSAEAKLQQDIKAIDPKLRDEDPAEWAARVQEFNQRHAGLAQLKQSARERYQANAQARAEEAKALTAKIRAEQMQMLVEKLPEWRDAKVAEAEQVSLANYAYKQGFTQQELDNLLDHRQVLILRKARLYDESRGQVDTAKKRVAKVPKVMKPGAPKPVEQRAAEKLEALRARMQKSGSIEDAFAYRMAKRGVSR